MADQINGKRSPILATSREDFASFEPDQELGVVDHDLQSESIELTRHAHASPGEWPVSAGSTGARALPNRQVPVGRAGNGRRFLTPAVLIVSLSLAVGGVTTWLWLNYRVILLLEEKLIRVLPIFFFVSCSTFVNLAFRWARWHFLLSRFRVKLIVRLSLKVYLISLVALLTPFYVGELARGKLYPGKEKVPFKILTMVWLFERLLDVLILGSFVLSAYLGLSWALMAVFSFIALSSILSGISQKTRTIQNSLAVLFLVSLSASAWLTTIVAFHFLVRFLGGDASFLELAGIFGKSTVLAGLTGIPTGAGVGGSLIILELQAIGLNSDLSVLCTAVFKLATTWIAVFTGVICLFVFRGFFQKEHAKQTHFDELSSHYDDDISPAIRERLLARKSDFIEAAVKRRLGRGVRGLDIGCGQGRYLIELNKRGYQVDGIDASMGQVRYGRRNLEASGIEARLQQGDATNIPYPDGHFDFAYAINLLHHITDRDEQQQAFAEIRRILKPGGIFVLLEMNVTNPLFYLYLTFIFPLIRFIDDGTERWIYSDDLPEIRGCEWDERVDYFTFLPDFLPGFFLERAVAIESYLEKSFLRRFSAHYCATLIVS